MTDRLPAATRPGRVLLQVADLQRSLDWYTGVLGLEVAERIGGEARLATGDEVLVELREHPDTAPHPRRGRLGLYHFALLLPDRAALGRFVAHLTGRGVDPGAADHLVSEALYLWDPDGLGVEVYADRPRDAWSWQGGELEMATLPLDLESLREAGGGAPWHGMPAGSTVGHVHLHVGDLAAAAAFYEAALGFEVTVQGYPGARFLSAGGYHHHLGVNTWAGTAAIPPLDHEARLLDWELLLPGAGDVEAAAQRLAEHGAAVDRGDGTVKLHDPWLTHLTLRTG
ncbi:MAG TPA: VOC family protein [Thermoanaerobaculia bacterium]|nr:VOC family protein [Thermoanaerobaculia bacterium]